MRKLVVRLNKSPSEAFCRHNSFCSQHACSIICRPLRRSSLSCDLKGHLDEGAHWGHVSPVLLKRKTATKYDREGIRPGYRTGGAYSLHIRQWTQCLKMKWLLHCKSFFDAVSKFALAPLLLSLRQ